MPHKIDKELLDRTGFLSSNESLQEDDLINELSADLPDEEADDFFALTISNKQQEMSDKLREISKEIKDEKQSKHLVVLASYVDIIHDELNKLERAGDLPLRMIDEVKRTKDAQEAASKNRQRVQDIGKRHNLDMDSYNQGCIDTFDLISRNLNRIVHSSPPKGE